jgi:hypothetical protein
MSRHLGMGDISKKDEQEIITEQENLSIDKKERWWLEEI